MIGKPRIRVVGLALVLLLGAAPALAGDAPAEAGKALAANPYLAPFPADRLRPRRFRSVAQGLIDDATSFAAGASASYSFSVPAQLPPDEAFVSVTGWVKTTERIVEWLRVSDGDESALAAPQFASDQWQSFTVVFPFALTSRDFVVEVTPQSAIELRGVTALAIEDDRYLREVCSKATEELPNGKMREYYELHEEQAYHKPRGRKRVLFVGNSTIDGCGSSKGATLSYILQQKLESLHPGRFEVINGGIGAANYVSHIVSITNHYPLMFDRWPNLDAMRRLQHAFPSVKDLDVDYLVLAVHWNDTREYRGWLTREPVDSKPTSTLLADRALDAVFRYLDDTTEDNLRTMNALHEQLVARPQSGASVWDGLAERHYRFLTLRYVERLQRHSPRTQVILMTLPHLERADGAPTKELPSAEPAMQRKVYREAAFSLSLPLIDHSRVFAERFHSDRKLVRYVRSEMMKDQIHFRYVGNQWLADQSYPGLIAAMSDEGGGE